MSTQNNDAENSHETWKEERMGVTRLSLFLLLLGFGIPLWMFSPPRVLSFFWERWILFFCFCFIFFGCFGLFMAYKIKQEHLHQSANKGY